MTEVKWSHYAPHPSITLILGAPGSYKTSNMCSILDYYHRKGYAICMVGSKDYVKLYPKWIKRVTPQTLDVPNQSVCGIDDAHLIFFSRSWSKKGERERREQLTQLSTLKRQKEISFVINTQNASFIDRNVIAMCDCVIVRKLSILQTKFERSEIQELMREAQVNLKGKSKRYAYIIHSEGADVVDTGKPPKWFTKEISKGHKDEKAIESKSSNSSIGKSIIEGIKLLGSMI